MIQDQKQLKELERLNDLIVSQSIQHEQTPSNRKLFNPQTGEMTLWVNDGRGGARFTSINIFGD